MTVRQMDFLSVVHWTILRSFKALQQTPGSVESDAQHKEIFSRKVQNVIFGVSYFPRKNPLEIPDRVDIDEHVLLLDT
jgi:hypothetical protein